MAQNPHRLGSPPPEGESVRITIFCVTMWENAIVELRLIGGRDNLELWLVTNTTKIRGQASQHAFKAAFKPCAFRMTSGG